MRFALATILISGFLQAQTTVPAAAASAPKQVPDDAVVATVNGKNITAGDVRKMFETIPPQFQASARVDPVQMIGFLEIQKYLEGLAEKAGLDKLSPYKEELEFQRASLLAQAEVNDYKNKILVKPEEQEAFYKQHPEKFRQAEVRVIRVAFAAGAAKPGEKTLTSAEAKAKIEDLRKRALAGEDFSKLASEFSDDRESAAKGGAWGAIKGSSNLPDPVKTAILSLKAGDISAPVEEPNGWYLFKVDKIELQPYEQVREQIYHDFQQERFDAWFKDIQKRFTVKVENSDFFPHSAAAPASH